MKLEDVSIIVPIYNVEEYIEKCLKSLICQDYPNIEILAISDGSKDKSYEIARKIARKDKKIKCIEKKNGGYGSVIEYALSIIKNKYFIICDPDDYLEKNAISKLMAAMYQYETDLIVAKKYLIFKNCNNKKIGTTYNEYYPITANKIYTDLTNFYFFSVTPHSKLFKTEFAQKIMFPHKVSFTDTILYYLYLEKIDSAVFIDEILAYYLLDRPGNTNQDLNKMSDSAYISTIIVIDSLLKQTDTNSNYNACTYYKIYTIILSLLKKLPKDNNFNKRLDEILIYIKKIQPQKKLMKKYIKGKNFLVISINKIIFNLILSKHFRKNKLKIFANISNTLKK